MPGTLGFHDGRRLEYAAMNRQIELFPPQITRSAEIPAGTVFNWKRPLLVVKVHGSDAAAPVIVEELASWGPSTLKGQLGLWSADSVTRAMRCNKL
jgi:hypothetical protein